MKREVGMRGLSCGLGLVLSGCLPLLPQVDNPDDACSTEFAPGTYRMRVDDYHRTPLIYIPEGQGPRPAVLMLHGAGGSEREFAWEITDVLQEAQSQGYVAIFANGAGMPGAYTWNADGCCGQAELFNADDLGFLDAVVDTARSQACVGDVLVAGHSNGAMMAQHWACQSDRMQAVFAAMGPLLDGVCEGSPIPIEVVVGEQDRTVPVRGGTMAGFPSSDQGLVPWLERNNCRADPKVTDRAEGVREEAWRCTDRVSRISLADWGHAWPGGRNGNAHGFRAESEITAMLESLKLVDDAATDDARTR